MTLDPTTLRETARIMRTTIRDEIPASPQQHGAFNDANLPKETPTERQQ